MGVSVYHREPIEEEFLIPDVAQAKLHRGIWPIYAEALNVSRLKSYHRYLYDNSTNILILFGKTISYQMCCFNSIFNLSPIPPIIHDNFLYINALCFSRPHLTPHLRPPILATWFSDDSSSARSFQVYLKIMLHRTLYLRTYTNNDGRSWRKIDNWKNED